MIEKGDHEPQAVFNIVTVYEENLSTKWKGKDEPQLVEAVKVTTPTEPATQFESVFRYPSEQFCP